MKPGKYETRPICGIRYPFLYVTDAVEAVNICERLFCQDQDFPWGLDLETRPNEGFLKYPKAGLKPHLSRPRLIQMFTGKTSVVIDWDAVCQSETDATAGLFNDHFQSLLEEKKFVGHNSVFDLQYLYRYFNIKHCDMGCTMMSTRLIYCATSPDDYNLRADLRTVTQAVLGDDLLKEMQSSKWETPELTFEQVEYSAMDPIVTRLIAQKLYKRLIKLGLGNVYKLYKEAQHAIVKMQLNGIKLDIDKHRDDLLGWRAELVKAKKELLKFTGLDRVTPQSIGDYLETKLPPDILKQWPRTATGKLSTDANTFADFSFVDVLKPFQKYQRLYKLTSSFGQKLITAVNPVTKRLHANYNISGARTGRLSSSGDLNIQQMPRDKAHEGFVFRDRFIAEEGNVLIVADYSSVEVRAQAEESKDPEMLKAYRLGHDIYSYTASKLLNKPVSEVTKEERQKEKCIILGLAYGMGAPKLKHYSKKGFGVDFSDKESRDQVKGYRGLYSVYREWQLQQVQECADHNFTSRSPMGKLRKYDPKFAYSAAINMRIQSGCAEVMLKSLCLLNERLPEDIKLLCSVHDEVILECPEKKAKEACKLLEDCMREGYLYIYPSGKTVKGLVDAHAGKTWQAAKG